MKINRTVKFFKCFFVIMITIFLTLNNKVFADELNSKEFIDINVPSAIVIDFVTGRVLFAKNADERRPMASLTKIMTSILLVENCDMDELIEVPGEATWIGGSEVGLKKGDKVTARSLLYGMLLPSR